MSPRPPVLIVAYDADWPRLYEIAREEIVQAIGGKFVLIEHVGSTAVPGLAAKPIIDVLVGVESSEESKAHVAPLVAADGSIWASTESSCATTFENGGLTDGIRIIST